MLGHCIISGLGLSWVKRFVHEFLGMRWKELFLLFSFLLLRAQKKKQEKGTPASPGPTGFPYFSTKAGRGKTRASPSDSSRVFSRPRLRGAAGQMGERKIPLARSRAPERLPKREFALFERSEFAKPRQHRGAQGIPPKAGQETQGAFSLVPFLWASKEMNIFTSCRSLMNSRLNHKKGRTPVGRPAFSHLRVKGATQRSAIP